jgi:DNA-binding CsgD family transcriptional regulator
MRWTLVGRDNVMISYRRALETGARGIELVGEAGVGKTRVLEELGSRAEGARRRVIRLKASRGARDIPLGTLSHVVQPDARPGESPEEAIWRAGRALVGVAEDSPLICLDDVHLLDDVSSAVLDRLLHDDSAQIAVARRADEPLSPAVSRLISDGPLVPITIGPLDEESSRKLAEEIVGCPLEPANARALWLKARGNPLFIRELITGAEASGGLRRNGVAHVDLDGPSHVRLRDIVRERLSHLSSAETRSLELLALSGPIGGRLAERLCPSEALEGLERRRLIEWSHDAGREIVQVRHPLYAEALRDSTPRSRQRMLFQELAQAIQGGGQQHEDLVLYATWGIKGGLALDAQVLVAAAEETVGRLSPEQALPLARAAVRAGGGPRAELIYGEGLLGAGHPKSAREVLGRLVDADHDDAVRARAATALAWTEFLSGESAAAARLLEDARADVSSGSLHDALAVQDAELRVPAGDYTTSRDLVDAVLAEDPGSVDERLYWSAQAVAAAREALGGAPAAGRARCTHILRHLEDHSETSPLMECRVTLIGEYCALQLQDAWSLYHRLRSQAPPEGAPAWAPFEALIGVVASHAGRPRTGLAHLGPALEGLRRADPLGQLSGSLANAAEAAAQVAEVEQSRRYLDELEALPPARLVNFAPETARARAGALACLGLREGARAAVESACGDGSAGPVTLEAPLCHMRALLGDAEGGRRGLEGIAAASEPGWVATALLEHARGLATGDPEALLAASGQLAAFGRSLRAAEAAVHAAKAFAAVGAPALAFRALLVAEHLERGLEGATTPSLQDRPAPLTPSERAAVEWATTTTHTAAAIGERLHKSVRTIENQLHSAYRKLGVSGRPELRELFAGYLPPPPSAP